METISAVIAGHQAGRRAKTQPPSFEYQFLSPRPSRRPVRIAAAAAEAAAEEAAEVSDGGDQMSIQGEVKAPPQEKTPELNNKKE